jgi:hypothetical protein
MNRPLLPAEPTMQSELLRTLWAVSTSDLIVLSDAIKQSPSTVSRRIAAELRQRRS